MIRHIKLRQLVIFDAVVRNRSYTRAAKELYISQPAVSLQMKQLESTVGAKLAVMQANQLVTTDAGERIYEMGRRISDELQSCVDDLVRLKIDDIEEQCFDCDDRELSQSELSQTGRNTHAITP